MAQFHYTIGSSWQPFFQKIVPDPFILTEFKGIDRLKVISILTLLSKLYHGCQGLTHVRLNHVYQITYLLDLPSIDLQYIGNSTNLWFVRFCEIVNIHLFLQNMFRLFPLNLDQLLDSKWPTVTVGICHQLESL